MPFGIQGITAGKVTRMTELHMTDWSPMPFGIQGITA